MKNRPAYIGYKNRLRSFKQYRNLSETELEGVARRLYNQRYGTEEELVENDQLVENEVGLWLDDKEAKSAQDLFDTYIKGRSSLTASDLGIIRNLVNLEIQIKRIQLSLNRQIQQDVAKGKPIPILSHELDTMSSLTEQVIKLKKLLGLSEEKKDQGVLEYVNTLKKKFEKWRLNNQGSRTFACPHCSKMVLLKIRTDKYDAIKHPFFFKDKVLSNAHLWDLYKNKKITLLDVCKVLLGKECDSTAYGEWLERKVFNVKEVKDPLDIKPQEELKESGN